MTNSQRLAVIRNALTVWLREHDSTANHLFRECMLIRDGFFCGRRFAHDSIDAVWFVEEDELKIRNAATGSLIETLQSGAIDELASKLPSESDSSGATHRHAA